MKNTLLITLLFLTSCASFNAAENCKDKAGPKPYAWAEVGGLPGTLIANLSDDRQAWYDRVDTCMDKWRAANP